MDKDWRSIMKTVREICEEINNRGQKELELKVNKIIDIVSVFGSAKFYRHFSKFDNNYKTWGIGNNINYSNITLLEVTNLLLLNGFKITKLANEVIKYRDYHNVYRTINEIKIFGFVIRKESRQYEGLAVVMKEMSTEVIEVSACCGYETK